MRRAYRLGCAAILGVAAIGAGLFFFMRQGSRYRPPAMAFQGDSADLRQTVVVPALDTPMPKGANVIWCGSIQLGWSQLEQKVLHGPARINGAEAVVSRLSRGELREEDVPSDSCVATAGLVRDGVVEYVKAEMQRLFQKEVAIGPVEPNGVLVYGYLETNAAFTVPFFDNREPFHFRGSRADETEVSSFGIRREDVYAYHRLRKQVDVLYVVRKNKTDEEADGFAIDLCRDSSPNQIVVACVPPKSSLLETLKDLENKSREYAKQPEAYGEFGVRDVLLVPNLNCEIRHHFTELEGRDKPFLNPGFNDYYIGSAEQTIRFKLDRSGAELASEFKAICKPMATHYVCDRPFMIYIKKRGADCPFFVMWVDNAELLCKP